MRTLWVGIRRQRLFCHSNHAHDMVEQMEQQNRAVSISEKIVFRAVRMSGWVIGIGMVVVQTANADEAFDLEKHKQYLWLAENWLKANGLGPENCILFHEDDADPVSDAPEVWLK